MIKKIFGILKQKNKCTGQITNSYVLFLVWSNLFVMVNIPIFLFFRTATFDSNFWMSFCSLYQGFFRRSIQKQIEYRCLRDGKCMVIRLNRNRCQYCRFKKCLAVGMSRDCKFTTSSNPLQTFTRNPFILYNSHKAMPIVITCLQWTLKTSNMCKKLISLYNISMLGWIKN